MMSLDNNIKSIFLIVLCMFFWIQDTTIKFISESINIYIIYIIRSIIRLLITLSIVD